MVLRDAVMQHCFSESPKSVVISVFVDAVFCTPLLDRKPAFLPCFNQLGPAVVTDYSNFIHGVPPDKKLKKLEKLICNDLCQEAT